MRSDPVESSASYAAEVARLLWPAPWETPYVTRDRRRLGQPHRDAYLFPSRRRPRLLVPADVPGSSIMLQRLGTGRSTLVEPARSLIERSVRSSAFAFARWPMLRVPATDPSADSIERHLAHCFGTEVRVGVLLGTRRVNQKPVLQVFDLDGGLRGYAKIGHNDLTAALVRREAAALGSMSEHRTRSFQAPRLIHHDRWAGLEVLVISPLTTEPRHEVLRSARVAAMVEVAHLAGTIRRPLGESGFWDRLRNSTELLRKEPDGEHLQAAVREVEETHHADPVCFGGWHGDWGRWNMGMGGGALKLWDWERYDQQVPIGFDGLHFDAQSVRPGDRDEHRQEKAFLRSVSATLAELGVPVSQHDLTLRLYLLEIAVRYVDALAHGATPALRRRTSWVLSLLGRLSAHPHPTSSEGRP
jgi:hypothetical protein